MFFVFSIAGARERKSGREPVWSNTFFLCVCGVSKRSEPKTCSFSAGSKQYAGAGAKTGANVQETATVSDTLGRFSKIGYSAPSAIPTPTGTFSEICQSGISNDTLFGADTPLAVK